MRLLLDTVTFIWAVNSSERLSRGALSALRSETTVLDLSSVSISEIAIKQVLAKLTFGKEKVLRAVADLQVHILPYSEEHAYRLFDLPLHHTDPFDRQLIAQALVENIPVVTPDSKFSLYPGVKVLW
jgi:PIN domain nuclease of toxin-antitoxin system